MITEYFISDNEDQRKENINNLVNYPLSEANGLSGFTILKNYEKILNMRKYLKIIR